MDGGPAVPLARAESIEGKVKDEEWRIGYCKV